MLCYIVQSLFGPDANKNKRKVEGGCVSKEIENSSFVENRSTIRLYEYSSTFTNTLIFELLFILL